jgi:hypothetical protein
MGLDAGIGNALLRTGRPWVFPSPKTGNPDHSYRAAWVAASDKPNLHELRMQIRATGAWLDLICSSSTWNTYLVPGNQARIKEVRLDLNPYLNASSL